MEFQRKEGKSMGMPIITGSGITRQAAITDLVESVALEQAALAHILNAEGKKIQKAVEGSVVASETMLKTNKSVKAMVDAVTKLEIVLQLKLELFEDCLCEEE